MRLSSAIISVAELRYLRLVEHSSQKLVRRRGKRQQREESGESPDPMEDAVFFLNVMLGHIIKNCRTLQTDHIPIRLVDGGSRCAGRVEVYYNGTWGTVCDDSWDLTDAHVVCKELNCGYAVNATVSSWFGQGSGRIWLDNVNCSANNSALWQCLGSPWGENDCIHKEDAGVICSGHRDIRLANGKNPCQGRLEVFFNGTWGTVCSDSFVTENADVVCAQLNCGSATSVEDSAAFGKGSGPIWLDDVRCRADDSLLWQCPSSPWGQHNCNHEEDVGVICSESHPSKNRIQGNRKKKIFYQVPGDFVLRLVAGFDNCSGRVEVVFSGTSGTVCDDSWDSHDASVVCRHLNCGDPVSASAGMLFPQGNGTIWMDEVECKGSYQLHPAPFSYLRAFVYVSPCILGSLLIVVSLYLVKGLLRGFRNGVRKWQLPLTGVPEPFYEEINIQESGAGLDSQSLGSENKLQYYVDSDLHEHKNENVEVSRIIAMFFLEQRNNISYSRVLWDHGCH
ncbi:deleted in malignant brain tumors 1 protein-like [Pristis pectinata]|uniref:deleted in malignant brain tumors 1 protein-like n=1 Tax=Pristis pectinata TaxID=685728 RepID=UPI00223E4655|nr:deleted in malignant brain tumors 1 protein-like [Pristis pectinata]